MVVCGLHRSGTTFVGKILGHGGVQVVHEPLNERFGMVEVPIAYPYAESKGDVYTGLLDDALNFARPWNRDVTYIQASSGMHRRLYARTGGRSGFRWGWLRLRHKLGLLPRHICLKDPFMSLATPWLVRHHGLRTLCIVRHPAAIHYSTEKQNWRFDIENLLRQPELINRYGFDIPKVHWELAMQHAAASIALLWKFMVRINSRLAKEDGRLKIITHESLCLEPVETACNICSHFQVPITSKLEHFVIESSEGNQAEATNGKIHDFLRDSRNLVNVWHDRIDKNDEAMIRNIAGDEVELLYSNW